MLYFENDKLSGIASDRSWNAELASYDTALAFYRVIDERARGTTVQARVYAYGREGSNGGTKAVVLQFADGRRTKLEAMSLDPGSDINQQVTVSECVGNCSDW